MVSLHGLALNVANDLRYDRFINPCGLTDRGITSLSHEAGRDVTIAEAKGVLVDELARIFDVRVRKRPRAARRGVNFYGN